MPPPRRSTFYRAQMREMLAPGSQDLVWRGKEEKGFWSAPRTMPLLLKLLNQKALTEGRDVTLPYLDIWFRNFGEGVVEFEDEAEHAYICGYTGSRAVRTWRERIECLSRAGALRVFPKGQREQGLCLVMHPDEVVRALHQRDLVDQEWLSLYQAFRLKSGVGVLSFPVTSSPT